MSFFRSTHKRTSPFFLNAVAIGAHKSVGAVTLVKIPSSSMCLSSDSTFGINAKGIIRAVVTQWGTASGFSVILPGGPFTHPCVTEYVPHSLFLHHESHAVCYAST